ncbi:hypothetical protein ANO11243_026980 [Dothideomycetidae sp. 11243]|nr:hypothetical protein ANO11243_026980 [fungal sp. No.11243]
MSSTSKRAINLILDWDSTLTKKDTLHLVAKIGYGKHGLPLNQSTPYPPPAIPWDAVGAKYMDKYNAHNEQYRPIAECRRSLLEERSWLASLRPVEIFGARCAEETEVFRGVLSKDIQHAATCAVKDGEVCLRPGWAELANYALDKGFFGILSVNWSATFIRHVMLAALTQNENQDLRGRLSGFARDGLRIDANEIQGIDQAGGSSGRLSSTDDSGDIRTSADKLQRMPPRCRMLNDGKRPDLDFSGPLVVYCGDSDTDLECLLAADVGICLQDNHMSSGQSALASTLKRLQIDSRPIEDLQASGLLGARLWTARDFHQIHQALKRIG